VAAGSVTWLHSPKLLAWQKVIVRELKRKVPRDKGMLWILSSGTQSLNDVKAIGLTQEALKASAQAVNDHLDASHKDIWLLAIPEYHIGGHMISVRAGLCGAKVKRLGNWHPAGFLKILADRKISLTSLVPTQIFDLVKARLSAPPGLRAVVVGGAALDPGLYLKGRALGWPLLPSYGLTECASQVATAGLGSLKRHEFPELKILRHVDVAIREQRIFLRSPSLCRYIARANREGLFTLEDPLRGGWLPTEDLGERAHGSLALRLLGRRDDVIKISGRLVAVNVVEQTARDFFSRHGLEGRIAVLPVEKAREGFCLWLITDSKQSLQQWRARLQEFNVLRPASQRLQSLIWIEKIPASELGKVQKARLRQRLRL